MKSVGNLNDFVRDHMLEPTDSTDRVRDIIGHFEDLTKAHDAVKRAREQLEALDPIVATAEKYDAALVERVGPGASSATPSGSSSPSSRSGLLAEEIAAHRGRRPATVRRAGRRAKTAAELAERARRADRGARAGRRRPDRRAGATRPTRRDLQAEKRRDARGLASTPPSRMPGSTRSPAESGLRARWPRVLPSSAPRLAEEKRALDAAREPRRSAGEGTRLERSRRSATS